MAKADAVGLTAAPADQTLAASGGVETGTSGPASTPSNATEALTSPAAVNGTAAAATLDAGQALAQLTQLPSTSPPATTASPLNGPIAGPGAANPLIYQAPNILRDPASDNTSTRLRTGPTTSAPLPTEGVLAPDNPAPSVTTPGILPGTRPVFTPEAGFMPEAGFTPEAGSTPEASAGPAADAAPLAAATATSGAATLAAPAATAQNPIVLENQKQGALPSQWQMNGPGSTNIEGYSQISVNVGQTVNFRINTNSTHYRIDIYRLGYYGGNGARLVTSIDHTGASGVNQPNPVVNPTTGEVDAGNWGITDTWGVPADATSGVYIAKLTRADGTAGVNEIPFIVRNDAANSAIVFQTADETWQAYNGWGGANLYGGNGPGPNGAAYAVSYNRPIGTRDGIGTYAGPQDFVFGAEYSAIRWMEQNGYDVSYLSGLDASTNASLLLNHKAYVSAGHDEYWTAAQRANVTAARDAGVNLAFLSGNEMYWETQLAPSIDGNNTPNTTLVSYKDTHAGDAINPSGVWTGTFTDPSFNPALGGNQPSNALTGTTFSVDSYRTDSITVPYGFTKLRFWANTPVAATPVGGTATLQQNILGYEWDSSPDNGFLPAGLIDLSSTTLPVSTLLLDYGNAVGNGTATHNLTLYRAASGALVFGAGTVFWSWGLDSNHDLTATPTDPSIQQAMVNLFAGFGVQPQTLQASLTLASQSTDLTPPVSKITTAANSSFAEATTVTITGTATDTGGGIVAGVQVSTDGGATWHQAGGTPAAWTYTWRTPAPGTYTIKSRATDDSVNTETPGAGIAVTVTPTPTVSLFSTADTPATPNDADARAIEVGVKFQSSTSGKVSAIRFYKGTQNTGTHVGHLWSVTGTLLATVTFTGETASGWQTATFSSPVAIAANTVYVASYHTNTGHYSDTPNYFSVTRTSGVLTAPESAFPTGPNGVYAVGAASAFPTSGIEAATNFYVDVVFTPPTGTNAGPAAVADGGFTTYSNVPLTIPAASLLGNDTDPNGDALTLTGVSAASQGTVSFDPNKQAVLFTPAAGYTGAASFTYSVSDGRGGASSASASLTINAAAPLISLFSAGAAPATVTEIDSRAVELGVKFQSSQSGTVVGLRFYKGPSNSGTHVGDLWSSTGTLLASATFTNETASGWQQVFFAKPVALTAGQTYIASYHTNVGFYSDTPGGFASAVTSGPLTAPSSAVAGGQGLYAYGPSGTFPTGNSGGTNYEVDVLFVPPGGASQPPVANNDSGFSTAKDTPVAIAASSLLANDTDPGGLTLSVTGVSGAVNGTVSYSAATQIATFTPTAGYTGPASFSYAISDGAGTASANVSLTVTAPVTTESLFSANATPATITNNDANAVELGVKFVAGVNGTVTGLRFYKGPQNTGTHAADLWSSTGTRLATATFLNETASGWQQVNFSTPVAVTAGATYVAAYHTNTGFYSSDNNYFSSGVTAGDLTAPASSASGGNGVYAYSAGSAFPTSTYNASNYWVDVQFAPAGGGGQPPVANPDSGFVTAANQAVSIQAASLLANDTASNGYSLSVSGVSGGVNGTASYNATNKTVQFVPAAGYTGSAGFTYSVSDGHGGAASSTAALTVGAAPATSTLFSAGSTPATITENDSSAVELGVKFQPSAAGKITGLRFYKGPQNTGTHIGNLWSATGTLLATATFAGETASGWQQVNLGAPVSVTAGTTYVASFHTDVGFYSANTNFFNTATTNGPLTAPSSASSGGNGVYAYGSASTFPTNSFGASNYWVDPVFQQLA